MERISPDRLDLIKSVMRAKGYTVYDDGRLNIVGIRLDHEISNKFDDTLVVFSGTDGWFMPCTTDPGSYYAQNPMHKYGTAVLAPGQYVDCYGIGLHQGKYEALVQVKPVTVFRDANCDSGIDYEHPETGMFGINIHRANAVVRSQQVDKWSAGCTVVADPDDFSFLMKLARVHCDTYGNRFTYTLMEEKDFDI